MMKKIKVQVLTKKNDNKIKYTFDLVNHHQPPAIEKDQFLQSNHNFLQLEHIHLSYNP
jgi:hypothetical protein